MKPSTRALFAVLPIALALGSSVSAETFVNPCKRGPLPNVSLINEARDSFVFFLTEVKPGMPISVGNEIAVRLCDDMSLVNDSEGLTAKLRALLKEYGY